MSNIKTPSSTEERNTRQNLVITLRNLDNVDFNINEASSWVNEKNAHTKKQLIDGSIVPSLWDRK